MPNKFIIIDLANTFSRAKHAAPRNSQLHDRIGFALHTTIACIHQAWKAHTGTHVVICAEGKNNWRKQFYAPYKQNRAEKRALMTPTEREEDSLFFEALGELVEFVKTKTNCTFLQHDRVEADDLIGGWIQHHPHDSHVITSTDTDFDQLLAHNVVQYNGVTKELHSLDGIFDQTGRRIIDKKTGMPIVPNPSWILFNKLIRGDSNDNVASAYPKIRLKSTKKKIGIIEAYENANKQGDAYNNFMNQQWNDSDGTIHIVGQDFARNTTLIDLSAQPPEIRQIINLTVQEQCTPKNRGMVGIKFMRFCTKNELIKMAEQSSIYSHMLNESYPG